MNDRKDLKIQALLEKISSLTADYENKAADYRVEITVLDEDLRNERQVTQSLQEELNRFKEAEVVQETQDSDDSFE